MAQVESISHSPTHRTVSPTISITNYSDEEQAFRNATAKSEEATLVPPSNGVKGSLSESDRYYTASSGEDYDDDDDDGMCIRLDSDDDSQSLSGIHINLKTLQAVSSMLAHYHPIIQRDAMGKPVFVPPPPPEEEYNEEEEIDDNSQSTNHGCSTSGTSPMKVDGYNENNPHDCPLIGEEDYQCAIQELENAIYDQDKSLLSDAMTELTDVMEKMTGVTETKNNA